MFKTILYSAFGAGLVVCLAITAFQLFTTEPLILHAEQFEGAGHDHGAGEGAHDHGPADAAASEEAEEWGPADGAERTAFTAVANFVVGMAVSLILLALMVISGQPIDARRGLLWGGAAFVAATLLPSLGLPPELPGTPAADVVARQTWWIGTVVASGAGLALIAFAGPWAAKLAGLAILVVPHVIGAPVPPSHDVSYPGALAGEFVVASLAVSALLWSVSGAAAGWIYQRLSRPA